MQSNLPNVWLAATNVVCLYPVFVALAAGDVFTALVLGTAGLFSGLYHLLESHKHAMRGFDCPPATSRRLLWLDRLGVLLAVVRMLYLVQAQFPHTYAAVPKYVVWLVVALGTVLLSEHDAYTKSPLPWSAHANYVAIHTLWHIAIFAITGNALRELVYVHR